MKLQKIKVHNFKCFKDAELSLGDLQTVTVIGANGAGKSTLVIDALTWCLYGRTALTDLKGYKQDDLVRAGTKECYVEVRFELSGDAYVVRRTYSSMRKSTSLEVLLNRKRFDLKVRDAEHFLSDRIGLDYDGFVNSTIIRQEEMKRLISEDPSKRKDILISLFRLGLYEEALQGTKEKRSEAEKALAETKGKLSTMEALVSQETDWLGKRKEIDTKIKEFEKGKAEFEHSLHTLDLTLPNLEQKTKELEIKEMKLDEANRRKESVEQQLKDCASSLSQLDEELKGYAARSVEADTLRRNYEHLLSMKDEFYNAKHRMEMVEQLINMRLRQEQGEINELEVEHKSLSNGSQSIIKLVGKRPTELATPTLIKKHRESICELEESAIDLGRAEKGTEVAKVAKCDRKKMAEIEKAETERRGKLASCRASVDETLMNLVTELPKQSETETKLEVIREREEEIDRRLAEKRRSLKEKSLIVGSINGGGPLALNEAERLVAEYTLRIDHLIKSGYNPDIIDNMKEKLDEATDAKEKLIDAKERMAATKSLVQSLTKETRKLKEESFELEENVKSSRGVKEEHQKAKNEFSALQNQYSDIKANLEGLKKQREEVEGNLKRIESYKTTLKELTNKQKELELNISDYRELESVLHRDGIPSAILNRIIPRVASESSSILAQLSSGRYDAITIEEQEDGRLNIWVKDGGEKYGVHRFSGGEKVRIALAVRLAISKVLSELPEAGKRLSSMRTLIIDEGDLGSLDGEGLNSTLDIITGLTKLFSLTILISHLEAIKASPAGNYLIVHKGDQASGSTIEYA